MHSNTLQGFVFFSIFNENPNLPQPPFESPSVISKNSEVLFQDISKIWREVLGNYCFAKLMQSLWKKKMKPLVSFSGVIVTDNPLQTLTHPSASWMIFHGFIGSHKWAFWQLDSELPTHKSWLSSGSTASWPCLVWLSGKGKIIHNNCSFKSGWNVIGRMHRWNLGINLNFSLEMLLVFQLPDLWLVIETYSSTSAV